MERKLNERTNKTEKIHDISTLSNQPGPKWRFPSGGKVAMCFKSFLRVRDKACHHQHYFPILVWPNTRTFHPSHVNGLTLDPNWPLLQRGCLVSRQQCLSPGCETWAHPQGHFSLGGESKTDKHKQEFQLWPRPSGVMPRRRTHQTGSLLQLDRTPFLTGHGRSLLHFIKRTPITACQQIEWTGTSLCSHINAHTLWQICVNTNRLTLFLIICW